MIVLYIILAIVALFILLLSIKFRIEAEYIDKFTLKVRWLFLSFTVYPFPEKKPKKPKKPKEPKEEQPQEEKPPEDIVEKKPNPFKVFYDNQGVKGVIGLIKDSADALGSMMRCFKKHFIIDDLYLWIVISKNQDAAGTAVEYGNVCKDVFPSLGYICSTLKVKNYDVNIEPDFIGTFSSAQFVFNASLRPIFLINYGIVFAVRMVKNVVLKILRAKPKVEDNQDTVTQNIKGGATNE